jgi:cell division protein FtsI (penicillin-binding protein 3)
MQVVTPKGTAPLAQVPGYEVAGKTGTAQKTGKDGRYGHKAYVTSFCGYMPARDPAFVGLVLVDEAQTKPGAAYGGQVAGPIFSRIGIRAARYLNLPPLEPPAPAANPGLAQIASKQPGTVTMGR